MFEAVIQIVVVIVLIGLGVTQVLRLRRGPATLAEAPLAFNPGPPAELVGRWGSMTAVERSTILPLSTVSGLGQPPLAVFVFDPEVSGFRRVGVADASGKVDLRDTGGDGIQLVRGRLYRLVARPQVGAFKPNRLCVSEATPGGADAWLVHDVRVGNRSQFAQAGSVPAGALRDVAGAFETVQTSMDFSVDVSYQGPAETASFVAAVVGASVDFAG